MESRQKRNIKKKPIRLAILMLAAAIFSTKVEAAASEQQGTSEGWYFRHWEARQRDYQQPLHGRYMSTPAPRTPILPTRAELTKAIESCNNKRVTELLEAGIGVNDRSAIFPNNTPLHEAALYGCLEIIDLLLAKGADINALNSANNPPLFETFISFRPISLTVTPAYIKAAKANAPAAVAKLLNTGNIDANQQFAKGNALEALIESSKVTENNIPIAFLLLNAGADKTLRNKSGETPAEIALKEAQDVISPTLKSNRLLLYNLIEMYPGKNLQERVIFSIAKNFYSDDAEMRALAEAQITELEKEGFAAKNPDLNRMLYLIIGKAIKEESNVQK